MTPEQQRALAIAQAKRKRAEATQGGAPQASGIGDYLYRNVFGGSPAGQETPGESLGTWLARGGESMTLGLLGDEANAAAYGLLPGRSYEGELERLRGNESRMSGLGGLSADITGALAPGLLGAGVVAGAQTLPRAIGLGASMGAGAGATQGFMEGEGGIGGRVSSAIPGAVIGGALGGAVPVVGEVARQGARAVEDWATSSRIGQSIGGQLGISPQAGQALSRVIGQDDPAAMRAALQRGGQGAMLADVSPQAGSMLDVAMRSPIQGARKASQRVEGRAGEAYTSVIDALNPMQGPRQPVAAAMEAIRTGSRPSLSDAYRRAYSKPIDYSSGAGAKLLDDITPRLPSEAISYANRLMRLKGEQSAKIMADIAQDGTVKFTRPPDVRQWDYIKQALDQMAESGEGAGALGGQTRLGSAYQSLARQVRDSVAEVVPEYKTALDTASDVIGRRHAVEFGSQLLSPKITTEEAMDRIARATRPDRDAMIVGLRGQLEEVMGNVRAVASDQNVDARQAVAAMREFSSPNAQRKMEALFGDEWGPVKKALDEASVALGLRARTAANSATAGRLMSDRAVQESVEPGALRRGEPLQATRNLIGGVTGASPDAIARLRDEVKGELADVLTRQGHPASDIDAVIKALLANRTNPQTGRMLQRGINAGGLGMIGNVTESLLSQLGLKP